MSGTDDEDGAARAPARPPDFDEAFRRQLYDLFAWRRDVRRFRREPLPAGALDRLLRLACLAPSVGLSQPWRFVTVDDPERRRGVIAEFERCNAAALRSLEGASAAAYARLKLAGLAEAPTQLAVFADRETGLGRGLGRQTQPETIDYSAVCAVYTLWLAARAEGIGVGWVSILDPGHMPQILAVPDHWRFIGYFCLGYPEKADDLPELEREGWETRRAAVEFILRR